VATLEGHFDPLYRSFDLDYPDQKRVDRFASKLAEYDRDRGAALLATLEEFLARRGNISATSDALFVHPNTLRQRLRRIADLTGIDLRRDDWLMVEIAVKLVRLRSALGAATPHT
jgi:DNA-binding PucR family transcriptional regulator